MREDELDVLRVGYAAFCRGDIDGLLECVHENLELHTYVEGAFHGHAGLLSWIKSLDEVWDPWSVAVKAIVDAGPCAIVVTRVRARSRASGITTDLPFWAVWEVVDGKAAFARHMLDIDAALAAARSPLQSSRSAAESEIRAAAEILRGRQTSPRSRSRDSPRP